MLLVGGLVLAICIDYPIMWLPTIVVGWWVYREIKYEEEVTQRKQREKEYYDATLAKAKNGDPAAKFDYGEIVLYGRGVKSDEKVAMQWIESAALMNEPRALFTLGIAYSEGKYGYKRDISLALKYFEKAKRYGHEGALLHINLLRQQLERLKAEEMERKMLNATENEWNEFKRFFDKCDSEPEVLLLKALIQVASLKPCGDVLRGKIEVIPQAKLLKYRVDFLVNNRLVVEVDGKMYHSDNKTFVNDRIRDQELILNGYQPIRFPASQIYDSAIESANIILKAAGL